MRRRTGCVKPGGLPAAGFSGQDGVMSDFIPASAPGAAVVARPAASLLVVRHLDDGPRILMARRGAGHRFMPNVLVFPGGAVDPEDYSAAVASPLRPEVLARVAGCAGPALAAALGVTAARELFEEVGMSLGTPPALHGLDFFARAITPPDRSMRFDAYFFAVDAALVTGEPTGSLELEAPGWYSMEQALAGELAGATRAVLAQFANWLVTPVHTGKVPVMRERVWIEE